MKVLWADSYSDTDNIGNIVQIFYSVLDKETNHA